MLFSSHVIQNNEIEMGHKQANERAEKKEERNLCEKTSTYIHALQINSNLLIIPAIWQAMQTNTRKISIIVSVIRLFRMLNNNNNNSSSSSTSQICIRKKGHAYFVCARNLLIVLSLSVASWFSHFQQIQQWLSQCG